MGPWRARVDWGKTLKTGSRGRQACRRCQKWSSCQLSPLFTASCRPMAGPSFVPGVRSAGRKGGRPDRCWAAAARLVSHQAPLLVVMRGPAEFNVATFLRPWTFGVLSARRSGSSSNGRHSPSRAGNRSSARRRPGNSGSADQYCTRLPWASRVSAWRCPLSWRLLRSCRS
jgi:hypothetical protein